MGSTSTHRLRTILQKHGNTCLSVTFFISWDRWVTNPTDITHVLSTMLTFNGVFKREKMPLRLQWRQQFFFPTSGGSKIFHPKSPTIASQLGSTRMRPFYPVQTQDKKSGSMARTEVAVGHSLYKNKVLTTTPQSQAVIFVTCVTLALSEHQI